MSTSHLYIKEYIKLK